MTTTLCCPKCDYVTPAEYEIGDAWCNTCECRIPSHDVDSCLLECAKEWRECDIEVMDEAKLLKEAEFWLYENHPDFCPNGFTGEEE